LIISEESFGEFEDNTENEGLSTDGSQWSVYLTNQEATAVHTSREGNSEMTGREFVGLKSYERLKRSPVPQISPDLIN